jgi:hypothetical protein
MSSRSSQVTPAASNPNETLETQVTWANRFEPNYVNVDLKLRNFVKLSELGELRSQEPWVSISHLYSSSESPSRFMATILKGIYSAVKLKAKLILSRRSLQDMLRDDPDSARKTINQDEFNKLIAKLQALGVLKKCSEWSYDPKTGKGKASVFELIDPELVALLTTVKLPDTIKRYSQETPHTLHMDSTGPYHEFETESEPEAEDEHELKKNSQSAAGPKGRGSEPVDYGPETKAQFLDAVELYNVTGKKCFDMVTGKDPKYFNSVLSRAGYVVKGTWTPLTLEHLLKEEVVPLDKDSSEEKW